ncbi:integrase arm-type DNA-binding domain-containing protein [Rhodoferax sp.]|uniref:tyrosine-type recombinase/integrase n=1 Tax=Rhodoferax sp. TaxID=50421 RepID=UPI00271F7A2B|nr:integrase arm-type DNA-binding domain-containing protein [Rhodoferax sp.]MDO9143237.1 integrase arm-type DNA-binding domain-containing protein [Rhodoferax sp.]MDP3192712.1 integrase arm-type DNA-binding domain-containing protein [Rhodoferax sp.]MDP3863522.1 integrase arm-type DNA-binding domain-containing protein [Rhodoferax sp.]
MLTDKHCKNAICPADKKRARFTDSGGLYLEVSPAGSKRWFWKLYANGKEGRMALGSYPAMGLADARKARDTVRLQKAGGHDPVQARKVEKLKASNPAGDTFQVVALEWYAKQAPQWSPAHADRSLRQFERDLFPWLGARRMKEIEPVELLATLRKVEERGAVETADRGLMLARQVWRYGVATGRVDRDITADLKGALSPYRGKHFAAITEPVKFGELLRALTAYRGSAAVRAALQLAPLLFQRPGELRGAAWSEVDLDAALWTIPAARMKRGKDGKENGDPHLVPLPRQAVEILRNLHPLTGHGTLIFPGERNHDRPISENSVRTALITLGYTSELHTWHGFRATARTMLAERLDCDPLIIEAQLAHAVKDANGRAYNRTQYLKHRTEMMQRWADYLDKLRKGADVFELPRQVA